MENLKVKCISLLKENHHVITTDSQAELVFNEIQDFVREEYLEQFILDDLCIFKNKEHAFDWFFGSCINLEDIDFTIDSDMIGKNIQDILLEGKENYVKINDGIHLTYWM